MTLATCDIARSSIYVYYFHSMKQCPNTHGIAGSECVNVNRMHVINVCEGKSLPLPVLGRTTTIHLIRLFRTLLLLARTFVEERCWMLLRMPLHRLKRIHVQQTVLWVSAKCSKLTPRAGRQAGSESSTSAHTHTLFIRRS